MKQDELWTPHEVAQYLRLTKLTVYKHAKSGKIPSFRVGNSYRFRRLLIEGLAQEKDYTKPVMFSLTKGEYAEVLQHEKDIISNSSIVDSNYCTSSNVNSNRRGV